MLARALVLAFLLDNPASALGVAALAAAIPILVHLLGRPRFRVVPWAAMRFLQAAQRRHGGRRPFEQRLLLATRIALVLSIVGAMASVTPWGDRAWSRVLPGSTASGAAAARRCHHVLVIDGSLSMGSRVAETTCFEKARGAALEILQHAQAGDGFSVLLMASPPRRVALGPSEEPDKVAEAIRGLRLPHGTADLSATVSILEEVLNSANSSEAFADRRVYFITDMQRSTWTPSQNEDLRRRLLGLAAHATVDLIDVGQDGLQNTAVTRLEIGDPVVITNAPVPVLATIYSYGTETCHALGATLRIGRARSEQSDAPFRLRVTEEQRVDVEPGQSANVAFTCRFPTPGEYAVQAAVSGDALELDNTRTIIVRVRDSVPVLLVNGRSDADPFREAASWVRDALSPSSEGTVSGDSFVRPQICTEADFHQLSQEQLAGFECVFLCDVPWLSLADARRLQNYVGGGGGLVIGLGPDVDVNAYNGVLCRGDEPLLPVQFAGYREAPRDRPFTLFAPEESLGQPPVRAFTGNDLAALMKARFRRFVSTELLPGARARSILSFVGPSVARPGAPALLEWQHRRGRVMLWTSTFNTDWTSWPLAPSFLPFMQELCRAALAGRRPEQAATVGDVLEQLVASSEATDVAFHLPDGRSELVHAALSDEGALARLADTDVAGIYRLTCGRHAQERLMAVNVPAPHGANQECESDLARATPEELRSAYPGWGFQIARQAAELAPPTPLPAGDRATRGAGSTAAQSALLVGLVAFLLEAVLAFRLSCLAGATTGLPTGRVPATGVALLSIAIATLLGGTILHGVRTSDFLGFFPASWKENAELLLGLPPLAAGEQARWRLELEPTFGTLREFGLVILGLAAAALFVFFYLRQHQAAGRSWSVALACLRLATTVLVFFVLVPRARIWFERREWPAIAILIDDSLSMATKDRYTDALHREAAERLGGEPAPDRLRLAQALLTGSSERLGWLQTLVSRRRRVHLYRAGQNAERLANSIDSPTQLPAAVHSLERLHANARASRLGLAVRRVLDEYRGQSLGAIVYLTDGITTEGDDLVKAARHAAENGVPLLLVGLGNDQEAPDIRLHALQVDDEAYVQDRLIFETQVSITGYSTITVPVVLRDKRTGRVLATQMTTVEPSRPTPVRLAYRPAEAGERTFVIETPVQPNEARADNNHLERTVNVKASRVVKVLYVEGPCRWEFQRIKALLEREAPEDANGRSVDLHVLLLDADSEWPRHDKTALAQFPDRRTLAGYDAIILGAVDPRDPRLAPHLHDVADFVTERGGGLLFVPGPRTDLALWESTPLAAILPVEPGAAATGPESPVRIELTASGLAHPMLRFSASDAENARAWLDLAPFTWCFSGCRARAGAEILAVPSLTTGQEAAYPLMAEQFAGAGRALFFGFDESWRWTTAESLERFNEFWLRVVRHLARNRPGRVRIRLDRTEAYRRGEPIRVSVLFPEDAPPPPVGTNVRVRLNRSLSNAGSVTSEGAMIALARQAGSRTMYEAIVSHTPEGHYDFELMTPYVEGEPARAHCSVLAPPGELDRVTMNRSDLEQAAAATRGHFYTIANCDRLIDDLPVGSRQASGVPETPWPLWNHPSVLILTLSLLGTEWLLRRWRNLR